MPRAWSVCSRQPAAARVANHAGADATCTSTWTRPACRGAGAFPHDAWPRISWLDDILIPDTDTDADADTNSRHHCHNYTHSHYPDGRERDCAGCVPAVQARRVHRHSGDCGGDLWQGQEWVLAGLPSCTVLTLDA